MKRVGNTTCCSLLIADIDECTTEIDNCHENATCNNTFGSFECGCNVGFDGGGVKCTSKACYMLMVEEKFTNVAFRTADPNISVCFVVSKQTSMFCCCSWVLVFAI